MLPWRVAQARASLSTLLGLRLLGEPHVPSARIMSRFNAPLPLVLVAGLVLERGVAVFLLPLASCLLALVDPPEGIKRYVLPSARRASLRTRV